MVSSDIFLSQTLSERPMVVVRTENIKEVIQLDFLNGDCYEATDPSN